VRKDAARSLGAGVVFDPTDADVVARTMELTDGRGVDVAFDAARIGGGASTWEMALAATRPAGTVVSIAVWEHTVEIGLNHLVLTEKHLTGAFAYVDQDFPTVIAMIADHRLPGLELVTSRIALDDVVERGFEELLTNRDAHVKILIEP
jgi:(R,R)-butanediol dehydrogenase / meso-butanediol dehydrogenase / diacetyl reductase